MTVKITDLPRVPHVLLVIESTHPLGECPGCQRAAHGADIYARVTGSVGCTYIEDGHTAVVASQRPFTQWHPCEIELADDEPTGWDDESTWGEPGHGIGR